MQAAWSHYFAGIHQHAHSASFGVPWGRFMHYFAGQNRCHLILRAVPFDFARSKSVAMNFTDVEVERFRQEKFAKIEEDLGEDESLGAYMEKYGAGSYGMHEALHVSSVFAAMLEEHLMEHHTVVADSDFYRLAFRAWEALNDLYQAIGAKHLADDVQG